MSFSLVRTLSLALALILSWTSICLAEPVDEKEAALLPGGPRPLPAYETLASGPHQVRWLPQSTGPVLFFAVASHKPAQRIIDAVKKYELGDGWLLFSPPIERTTAELDVYLKTHLPLLLAFPTTDIVTGAFANNADYKALMDALAASYGQEQYYGALVCEWGNCLYWPDGLESIYQIDRKTLGKSGQEHADRTHFYAKLTEANQRWIKMIGNSVVSLDGYNQFQHLAAEAGYPVIANETGENIPASQVQRAFIRGASRQFDRPWIEDVSQWYLTTVPSGVPGLHKITAGGGAGFVFHIGEHAGHSVSYLERMWYTSWMSGTAGLINEASSGYMFNLPYCNMEYDNGVEVPEDVALSKCGEASRRYFRLTKAHQPGIPYTPFGVLVSKYHGRNTTWGKAWQHLEETPGDKSLVRFFDQIFPGQSAGPGDEERQLCPSPYGDSFDVLVNDADPAAWSAYPVLLAVGDMPWTPKDIEALKAYVNNGGTLALNETHLAGWPDRAFLGLAEEGFSPAGKGLAVLAGSEGQALLVRHDIGQGHVFVAARQCEPGSTEDFAFPTALLDALAQAYLPFQVSGKIETLLARTPKGWTMLLVNNGGIRKKPMEEEQIDPSAAQTVRIAWNGPAARVSDWLEGTELDTASAESKDSHVLEVTVAPGSLRLLSFEM